MRRQATTDGSGYNVVAMQTLAPGVRYVDLQFLGRAEVIATAVLLSAGGAALVDPGPSTCLDTLRSTLERHGVGIGDVRQILLTHIHLDHAGVTGTLMRENDEVVVYVHERGARHLIDPGRLLESAGRLYGAQMDRLWGQILPVPADRVRSLAGGERLVVGDRALEVAYTPGHASHHVSYFDRSSGIAYVGDTAGIRTPHAEFVLPPTPPPDIDLEAWHGSIERIAAWQPDTLFLTHFGPAGAPAAHLRDLGDQLRTTSDLVRQSLERGGSDAERFDWFAAEFGRHLRRHLPEPEAARYESAAPMSYNWQGLARYWRKRTDRRV